MNTLQTRLARLKSQLKITKGNRAKAKIVIEILKVESAIEQLKPKKQITLTWEQQRSLNALTGGQFIFSKLTEESKKQLLKIVEELEDLEREEYRDKCTGKGLWKRPSEASIKRSEKRSNKYRLLRERVSKLELIQEEPSEVKEKEIKVKDIIVKIPVSVSTLKKHCCNVPSSKLTDKEIIDGWKYSLAAQSMQRDFRTQKDIQWGDRHLLLQVVYWVDQYQQEMDKRGLTEKYCLWIEKKQAFKDEFYRKPEKTINKSKDTQINITETQAIELRTKQLELNLFGEMPCVNKFQEVIDNTKFTKQTISILNREGETRKVKGEALGDYLISAGGNDAYCIYHIPTGLEIMSSVGFKTRNPVKYENLSEKEAARLAVKKLVAANIDIPGSYLEWNKYSAIEKAKIGQNIIDAFDDKAKAS
jgi:hypothetical protein